MRAPRAVLSTLTPLRSEDVGKLVGLGLCRRHYSHHVGETRSIDAPALRQREGLVAVRLGAEKRSDFIKDAAEVSSRGQSFNPAHGLVPLLDTPMVLFYMIVQVPVRPVRDPLPEDVLNRARLCIVAIRGDPVRFCYKNNR
jgi:hypothetical protein